MDITYVLGTIKFSQVFGICLSFGCKKKYRILYSIGGFAELERLNANNTKLYSNWKHWLSLRVECQHWGLVATCQCHRAFNI